MVTGAAAGQIALGRCVRITCEKFNVSVSVAEWAFLSEEESGERVQAALSSASFLAC